MLKMKRFIGLSLAVCLTAACLVACGNGSNGSSSSSSSSAQQSKQESSSTSSEAQESTASPEDELGVWAPLPEEVTISMGRPEPIIDLGFVDGEDLEHNVWTDRYHDLFNVNFEYEWLVPDSEYNQKINLCIADNDLPDVFRISSLSQYRELAESGMIMDITDVFEQYGSDLIKSYFEAHPEIADTAYVDGKLYGIPQFSAGDIAQPPALWIRKDWMLENNLEEPKTWDDLVNIIEVFHDKYGATLGLQSNLTEFREMGPIWGSYPITWIRTENGVEYGGIQPEVKEELAALHDLYDRGLIDDQWVATDSNEYVDMIMQDKFGVFIAKTWCDSYYRTVMEEQGLDFSSNHWADAYALPSANGEVVKLPLTFGNYGYICINSDVEHPEAVIKCLNLQPQVYYEGNEGAYGEIPEDIKEKYWRINHTVVGFFRVYDPDCDYTIHKLFAEAIKTGDDSEILGKGVAISGNWGRVRSYLDYLEDPDSVPFEDALSGLFEATQKGGERGGYEVIAKFIDDGNIFYNVLWGESPESYQKMNSSIQTILNVGCTQIISGEKPIDYFDEMVEEWKKAGGDQVTKDMNEMYGE